MKKLNLTAVAMLLSMAATAANTVTQTEQVTSNVTLTTDVDYVITGTTPFTTAGSVDIQNTDHAVIIFKYIKPSKVISNLMGNIFINGVPAKNGTNCQVKMFNRGAIVLPYGDSTKPLTCYTEENYEGDSYNNYGLGNTGGFMNTLSTAQLNNNIRSFKLKRGYMVTFATGVSGWGYSRCFIADMEDLEITSVPAPLNGKISSYRIFKWQNASKAGVHDTSKAANDALNTTSCFDWGQGNASLLPDVEWVSHHIYEDWPSAATCGGVSQTCHMKTNNEPGNSADDHPQDVETVLNNWQNLMRTGMRLCSESSHDGSMNHLKEFIEEIDKRGWRCDILDLHGYWQASNFNNLNWYSDYYGNGRPIWMSEWVWGASWNHNGFWGSVSDANSLSSENQTILLNGTKPILEAMNNNPRVERYYYWNSEAAGTHIYHNGKLTKLGEYYANMETGLAYNAKYEYVPKIVYNAPGEMTLNYTKRTGLVELAWSDPNGDMIDSIVVECKLPGSSMWKKIANVEVKDQNGKNGIEYTYEETINEVGIYYYRIAEYYDNKKIFRTNEQSVTVAAAKNVGLLQYGQLRIANDASLTTDIDAQDKAPYVVMGMPSNANTSNGITNQVQSIGKSSFKFRFYPWQLDTPVEFNKAETVDYLILPSDTVIHLANDMMLISQKAGNVKGAEVQITFPQPFPEGVTPVVVVQQNTSITSYAPVTPRIYDVTNTGFKLILTRQEKATGAFNNQNVNYFACTPGQAPLGGGIMLTVGRDEDTPVGGSARQSINFVNQAGEQQMLQNAFIIAQPQTFNYGVTAVFRQHSLAKTEGAVTGASVRRQVDGTTTTTEQNSARQNGDYIGWMIVSDDPNGSVDDKPVIGTGIAGMEQANLAITVSDGQLLSNNDKLQAYDATGKKVPFGRKLPRGIYFITDGHITTKVVLR